jgi:hypothetical protein
MNLTDDGTLGAVAHASVLAAVDPDLPEGARLGEGTA